MLAIFGLFGALLAGLAVDSAMRPAEEDDSDEQLPQDQFENDLELSLSMVSSSSLEILTPDLGAADDSDGQPRSDDVADPQDVPMILNGDDGDNAMSGGGAADQVSGQSGQDMLSGNGGNDILNGQEGVDFLYGDAGDDSLFGGDGADSLYGGDGQDIVDGAAGDDQLFGHGQNDQLTGGVGKDQLAGGEGDDQLWGGMDDDALSGGIGDDAIFGGQGNDVVNGNDGNDTLWSGLGQNGDLETDFLNGGNGDDVLMLGAGDYAYGDQGADVFTLDWTAQGSDPAVISDFDQTEDSLVVVYDSIAHPAPRLSMETSLETGAITLLLDGLPLINLPANDGFDLAQVQLLSA